MIFFQNRGFFLNLIIFKIIVGLIFPINNKIFLIYFF